MEKTDLTTVDPRGWQSGARLPVVSVEALMGSQWKSLEDRHRQLPMFDMWPPFISAPMPKMVSSMAQLMVPPEWAYQYQMDQLTLPLLSPSGQDEESISSRSGSSYSQSGGSSPMRLPLRSDDSRGSSSSELENGHYRDIGLYYPQGIIPIPIQLAPFSNSSPHSHLSLIEYDQLRQLAAQKSTDLSVASFLSSPFPQWRPPMASVGQGLCEAPKMTQDGSSILKPLPNFTNAEDKLANSVYRKLLRTYRCKQCDYVAKSKDDYWSHSRVHIKVHKLLSCPKCMFVTEHKHHLEYHLRNHFGSKPFKCPKCPYSCVNNSMLKSHLKSHTNQCEYKCADCDYATKYCHSLKLHLRKRSHKAADPEMLNGFRKWSVGSATTTTTTDSGL